MAGPDDDQERSTTGALRDLPPAYFALVMATGIVSIGADQVGLRWLALALLGLNALAYPTLVTLTLLRARRHRAQLVADLTDHQRAPGFFTIVAGTCVLGTQVLRLAGSLTAAVAFLVAGLVLWVLLTYGIFTACRGDGAIAGGRFLARRSPARPVAEVGGGGPE
jgi:tellurite resistance protein TehA-like permease